MAAFINALYEEGSREDCLRFIHKGREDNNLCQLPDEHYQTWNKSMLLDEVIRLWNLRTGVQ